MHTNISMAALLDDNQEAPKNINISEAERIGNIINKYLF